MLFVYVIINERVINNNVLIMYTILYLVFNAFWFCFCVSLLSRWTLVEAVGPLEVHSVNQSTVLSA